MTGRTGTPGGKLQQKQRLEESKARKTKVTQTVWIGGDPEKLAALMEKDGRRQRIEAMTMVRGQKQEEADRLALLQLEEEIATIKEELRETAIPFTFQSIGRQAYEKHLRDNPPTDEQVVLAQKENEQLGFNPEVFPFVLIDASCVDPEHEPGEMQKWLQDDPDGEWNIAEINDLFQAALAVNTDRSRVNLGKGFR
jgi:hypothetical protein